MALQPADEAYILSSNFGPKRSTGNGVLSVGIEYSMRDVVYVTLTDTALEATAWVI